MIHNTTVIGLIHKGKAVIGSDGQATMNKTIVKSSVNKLRKLYNGEVLVGFAGSTADALTLFDLFEEQLMNYSGNIRRSAVEMAKKWRKDKLLRHLEALLCCINKETVLIISGSGDIIEPEDNIVAIGSGGMYALAAAKAMKKHTSNMDAKDIVIHALHIAADICIYTNHHQNILELDGKS